MGCHWQVKITKSFVSPVPSILVETLEKLLELRNSSKLEEICGRPYLLPLLLDTTLWCQAVSKDPRLLTVQEKSKNKIRFGIEVRKNCD